MTPKLIIEIGMLIGLIVLYFFAFNSKKSAVRDKGYYALYSLILLALASVISIWVVYL